MQTTTVPNCPLPEGHLPATTISVHLNSSSHCTHTHSTQKGQQWPAGSLKPSQCCACEDQLSFLHDLQRHKIQTRNCKLKSLKQTCRWHNAHQDLCAREATAQSQYYTRHNLKCWGIHSGWQALIATCKITVSKSTDFSSRGIILNYWKHLGCGIELQIHV